MSNNIKLFAQNANTGVLIDSADNTISINNYDRNSGVKLNDVGYENRSERKTGFIPNTGASSITLNTALYQQSVLAKILADIVTSTDLFGSDVVDVSGDNYIDKANELISLLNKINGLITGTQKASKAAYAEVATNYIDDNGNQQSINATVNNIQNNITSLQNFINNQSSIDVLGNTIYYRDNIVWGTVKHNDLSVVDDMFVITDNDIPVFGYDDFSSAGNSATRYFVLGTISNQKFRPTRDYTFPISYIAIVTRGGTNYLLSLQGTGKIVASNGNIILYEDFLKTWPGPNFDLYSIYAYEFKLGYDRVHGNN